jgi:hypothetical protein
VLPIVSSVDIGNRPYIALAHGVHCAYAHIRNADGVAL